MKTGIGSIARILLLLASAVSAGCLQIETRVRLHEDGSATITERLQLSQRLLEMSREGKSPIDVTSYLAKEAALERMKHMGKGVEFVRHEARDAEQGAKESVSVYRIAHINDFRYMSPYLATLKYPKHNAVKFTMFPIYESTWYGRIAGQMGVTVKPVSTERRRKDEGLPPEPTPLERQTIRELRLAFGDMMQDLHVRLTFESYGSLRFRQYYRFRGGRGGTKEYDLIDFSGKDLDKYGYRFLLNEEIMVELLEGKVGGANVKEHVAGHAENLTVPVYHPGGTPEIYFRPSRFLFDKHFKGKTLKFDKRAGGPRKANFKEVGHRPNINQEGRK